MKILWGSKIIKFPKKNFHWISLKLQISITNRPEINFSHSWKMRLISRHRKCESNYWSTYISSNAVATMTLMKFIFMYFTSYDSPQSFIAKAFDTLIFSHCFLNETKFMVHNVAVGCDEQFFFLHPHFHRCLSAFSSISASFKLDDYKFCELDTFSSSSSSSSVLPRETYVIKTVEEEEEMWDWGANKSVIHKALIWKKRSKF